jgi:hypothetical protein
MRQLSEEIRNSESPSVQIVFELMTTREMLVEMKNAESAEAEIQQCIDQIDELMETWDTKLGNTIGERS